MSGTEIVIERTVRPPRGVSEAECPTEGTAVSCNHWLFCCSLFLASLDSIGWTFRMKLADSLHVPGFTFASISNLHLCPVMERAHPRSGASGRPLVNIGPGIWAVVGPGSDEEPRTPKSVTGPGSRLHFGPKSWRGRCLFFFADSQPEGLPATSTGSGSPSARNAV
jgi:hypothetical protein